jgi:hypothetical protein
MNAVTHGIAGSSKGNAPMKIAGMEVQNATKPVTIVITKGDVAKGATKDPAACAAARACVRDLHASEARVHVGRTYVKIDNKWIRYNTGPALRTEVVAFDRGGAFEPGKYTLVPVPPSHRANGKRQGGASQNQRPRHPGKKRPLPRHVTTGIREHGANK